MTVKKDTIEYKQNKNERIIRQMIDKEETGKVILIDWEVWRKERNTQSKFWHEERELKFFGLIKRIHLSNPNDQTAVSYSM